MRCKLMHKNIPVATLEFDEITGVFTKIYDINPEDADTLHASCTDEVKKINGAIQFPYNAKDDN